LSRTRADALRKLVLMVMCTLLDTNTIPVQNLIHFAHEENFRQII
jgi:hypothetical protein